MLHEMTRCQHVEIDAARLLLLLAAGRAPLQLLFMQKRKVSEQTPACGSTRNGREYMSDGRSRGVTGGKQGKERGIGRSRVAR